MLLELCLDLQTKCSAGEWGFSGVLSRHVDDRCRVAPQNLVGPVDCDHCATVDLLEADRQLVGHPSAPKVSTTADRPPYFQAQPMGATQPSACCTESSFFPTCAYGALCAPFHRTRTQ